MFVSPCSWWNAWEADFQEIHRVVQFLRSRVDIECMEKVNRQVMQPPLPNVGGFHLQDAIAASLVLPFLDKWRQRLQEAWTKQWEPGLAMVVKRSRSTTLNDFAPSTLPEPMSAHEETRIVPWNNKWNLHISLGPSSKCIDMGNSVLSSRLVHAQEEVALDPPIQDESESTSPVPPVQVRKEQAMEDSKEPPLTWTIGHETCTWRFALSPPDPLPTLVPVIVPPSALYTNIIDTVTDSAPVRTKVSFLSSDIQDTLKKRRVLPGFLSQPP